MQVNDILDTLADFKDVFGIETGIANKEEKQVNIDSKTINNHKRIVCLENIDKHIYRRAFGTIRLLESIKKFNKGHSYHFMTGGDVDALSYLQLILLHQPLEYCLFSTWCMAAPDVVMFDDWLTNKKIAKLDAYVGEIFPSSYPEQWIMLNELIDKHKCGRIAVFRNHSKIFAGYGPKFAFGIETSANIMTNPRAENGCITIGEEIYKFYREYFDGIISIVKKEIKNAGQES